TVEAVTANFPNLPAPPDMTYGQPTPGPGAPGPGAPFTGTPSVGAPGGGTPSFRAPGGGTPSFGTPGMGNPCTSVPGTAFPGTGGTAAIPGCPSGAGDTKTPGQSTGPVSNGQNPLPSALTDPAQATSANGLAGNLSNGVNQALGPAMGAAQLGSGL